MRGAGIELRSGFHRGVNLEEDFAYGTGQRVSQGRGHHFAPHLDQEFIREVLAQPSEGSTHRGLRQKNTPAGFGNIAFGQQGIERDEQI
jgi:hypothetical protein